MPEVPHVNIGNHGNHFSKKQNTLAQMVLGDLFYGNRGPRSFSGCLQEAGENLGEMIDGLPDPSEVLDSPDKEMSAHFVQTHKTVQNLIEKARSIVKQGQKKSANFITSWERTNKYNPAKSAYEKSVRPEKHLGQLETQRQKYVGEKENTQRWGPNGPARCP